MALDLEAFKTIWAEQDRKLDESLRLSRAALRENAMRRTRSALWPLLAGLCVEVVVNLISVAWLGSFVAAHWGEPKFVVPAVALDALAVGALVAAIGQAVAAGRIDYAGPVASVARELEGLRVMRLRSIRWTFLVAPLAWTPLAIVALRAFLGIDAYAAFGGTYVAANLAFGLAFLAFGYWAAKAAGPRLMGNRILAYVARTFEGGSLRAARRALASAREFETTASTR